MRSYTIPLETNQALTSPGLIDHYFFYAPDEGVGPNFTYPTTAFGGEYSTTVFDLTADDSSFDSWGYAVQDIFRSIEVGPLKGPYTITFDPSTVDNSLYAVFKIVYDFGDGESLTVNRSLISQLTQGGSVSAGDPKLIPVTHEYYPSATGEVTVYKPKVTVYNASLIQDVFNISISSVAASIYEFDDIHLINTTQQLSIAESRNIFETESPNYLTVSKVISTFDANHQTAIPFNPKTSLPGYEGNLVLWLDASDSFTILKDYNNYVQRWDDKSSYENNFFATSFIKPIYLYATSSFSNRKSITFKGSNALEAASSPSLNSIFNGNNSPNGPGYTAFIVMQSNGVGGTVFSYDIQGITSPIPNLNLSFDGVTNGFIARQDGQATRFDNISDNLPGYGLFSITLSGTTAARAYLTADTLIARRTNQNYTYNFSEFINPTLTKAAIGKSYSFAGNTLADAEISEILIYNTPLDPASIAAVNNYLIKKWNLVLKTN